MVRNAYPAILPEAFQDAVAASFRATRHVDKVRDTEDDLMGINSHRRRGLLKL